MEASGTDRPKNQIASDDNEWIANGEIDQW